MGQWQSKQSEFLADGQRRLATGIEAEIRASVEAKFGESLQAVSPLRRFLIRRRIEHEIRRLVSKRLPDDVLY